MMQGQSSKAIKGTIPNQIHPRVAKFSSLDPFLNDFPLSAPSLDQEDNTLHLNDFPCSEDISSITQLNRLRVTDTCPLPRSGNSDITQCQSGLANFSYFSQFASMATSSVCSANGFDRASNDPAFRSKRKSPETGDSESHNDEAEEESVAFKKTNRGRKGSKRSRASEVHNLSERRRRERINEKMRALQELLPNCNKVDKASMLDEAIEYLKALQLQVQALSMGAGMCMPPMMLPAAMQPMHRAQSFPSNYSTAQTPSTQGPGYLAHLSQELPISMPCVKLPFSESPILRPRTSD